MSKMLKDWYKYRETGSFFGEFYIKGDHSLEGFIKGKKLSNSQRTEREVAGLIDLLDIDNNFEYEILDAPCGYGRHTKHLVRLGYKVSCLDINPYFIQKIKEEIPGVKDIKNCELKEINYNDNQFDIVLNMFFSFGFYANEHLNIKAMQEFFRVLKKGGRLLLHTDVNMKMIESGKYSLHELRHLKDGGKLLINEEYHARTKRLEGAWTILDKLGNGSAYEYNMRIYSLEEYEMLCRCVGFRKIDVYGSFDKDSREFSHDSQELILICTK